MDSFGTRRQLDLAGKERTIFSLRALEQKGHDLTRLPYSLKVFLENLLRNEDGARVERKDVEALLAWDPKAQPTAEISFSPARVLLQDFTGVPCVVDLASMRDAMAALGGDPNKINPLQPVELVIDHSVQVDAYGSEAALLINLDHEYERNNERYQFLKWGQGAFENFKVVPPNTGICHQVNLEYLARVVFDSEGVCYPDTLVGTDSHTTMVNGLGVLGWGVGGIEAEAAMLGQPVSMLLPQVVGFRLTGQLREGATATDLVLTVTEMLRKHGVVGKFVEFYGPGVSTLPLADRATIANMAPEYGATCGLFMIDEETLRYLRTSGRPESQVDLVEAYAREQGIFHQPGGAEAEYSSTLELDLGDVEPSVAGPKRPQDRSPLAKARDSFFQAFPNAVPGSDRPREKGGAAVMDRAKTETLTHASVVIAAITSCTNTSNPSVMMAAGLVAKKANALGLKPKPWVKTSLAPGSKVVTEYLQAAGLLAELDAIGFNLVGYGCTTCIGNSGPLPEDVSREVNQRDLTVVSVLSGNRNFEGRVNQEVKANYLMSPPLVVAYSLAGTIDIDLANEPIAQTPSGHDVYLRDLWPSQAEIAVTVERHITREMFTQSYATVFDGDAKWQGISTAASDRYDWDGSSTYVKGAPYFEGMRPDPADHIEDLNGMKCLALLGDSITTDHISPAGSIKPNSPAGEYLVQNNVRPHLFNSYGSRRGNHEVMIRGTFANVRLRNLLAPGTEGGFTTHLPTGQVTTIYEASRRYAERATPLIVVAGKEYGTGSSRDWAAKGTLLLGVKAVLAESFERIHRSNLIGMGVLPLQFAAGEGAASLCLTGHEEFALVGLSEAYDAGTLVGSTLTMRATDDGGMTRQFQVLVRIDTPMEAQYYRHGGILQYVLRQLLNA
ncbi:MAG: aconitate hydratase AcnA [Fimbriimonadaceae bacterium]|nr:aconitate hydratase AcnA [Fimbriimonadaceae bacterium]QYK56125.1 MAG: aconitate hydratase AcnA [Fimbriimonadaceae bacterium]